MSPVATPEAVERAKSLALAGLLAQIGGFVASVLFGGVSFFAGLILLGNDDSDGWAALGWFIFGLIVAGIVGFVVTVLLDWRLLLRAQVPRAGQVVGLAVGLTIVLAPLLTALTGRGSNIGIPFVASPIVTPVMNLVAHAVLTDEPKTFRELTALITAGVLVLTAVLGFLS